MKSIVVIGGGLAGLTLGIGLRRRGVPVSVIESGHYPRHKVCGEFISGEGQEVLARLGLLETVRGQGVCEAATARFVIAGKSGPIRNLPQRAICISRYKLDAMLAELFEALGGELKPNTRAALDGLGEGTVRASGRRAVPVDDGWAWYGLKIHARSFRLEADFEMHAFENGYVGLCRLPEDEVNICGLFRKRVQRSVDEKSAGGNEGESGGGPPHSKTLRNEERAGTSRERHGVRGSSSAFAKGNPPPHVGGYRDQPPHPARRDGYKRLAADIPEGSALRGRFAEASLDESSFCSVAGLSLAPQKAAALNECCLGDALTMTPPVTGNGMSMAFESAEIAIEPLAAYARNELSWAGAKGRIARACDERFASRLQWARWLQWMMFSRSFQHSVGSLALRSHLVWNTLFRQTR